MTAQWWDRDQPAPVRAVLDLAHMAPEFGDDTFARILDTFAPNHANEILLIAADLTWAERFASDYPTDVIADYYGGHVTGLHALDTAERLAEQKRASALTAAQFVASLLTRPTLAVAR